MKPQRKTAKNTKKPIRRKKSLNYGAIAVVLLAMAAIVLVSILLLLPGSPDDVSKELSDISEVDFDSAPAPDVSDTDTSSRDPVVDTSIDETSSGDESEIQRDYDYEIDITEYEKYIQPADDTPYLILVSPVSPVSEDYVPQNLVDVTYTRKDGRSTQKMVKTAEMALQAFLGEGKKHGVTNVTVTSAYRSYAYQSQLFNNNVEKVIHKFATREECEDHVATYSARPGTSEHQSGLVCDMHNLSSAQQSFAKTPEAKWLAENAHKFGFILRYPEDKTHITGIIFEPWHFRFVGRTAATIIYENGWCLEEYLESLND